MFTFQIGINVHKFTYTCQAHKRNSKFFFLNFILVQLRLATGKIIIFLFQIIFIGDIVCVRLCGESQFGDRI